MKNSQKIEKAEGKLGIMLVGLGAVSTTTIAGVIAIRRGLAKPIGSLTQMGTIRLGKRTDNRSPKINEFVPLAKLDDVVKHYDEKMSLSLTADQQHDLVEFLKSL